MTRSKQQGLQTTRKLRVRRDTGINKQMAAAAIMGINSALSGGDWSRRK